MLNFNVLDENIVIVIEKIIHELQIPVDNTVYRLKLKNLPTSAVSSALYLYAESKKQRIIKVIFCWL